MRWESWELGTGCLVYFLFHNGSTGRWRWCSQTEQMVNLMLWWLLKKCCIHFCHSSGNIDTFKSLLMLLSNDHQREHNFVQIEDGSKVNYSTTPTGHQLVPRHCRPSPRAYIERVRRDRMRCFCFTFARRWDCGSIKAGSSRGDDNNSKTHKCSRAVIEDYNKWCAAMYEYGSCQPASPSHTGFYIRTWTLVTNFLLLLLLFSQMLVQEVI